MPLLRLMGHLSLAWMWARMAVIGQANAGSADPIYAAKVATARFYFRKLLPETQALATMLLSRSEPVMALVLEGF